MNVNIFKSNFFGDVARPNLFAVIINRPKKLTSRTSSDNVFEKITDFLQPSARLSLLCQASEFPGKTIQTTDYYEYGLTRKIALGGAYDDITLEFIVSDDMMAKRFFELWLDLIANNEQSVNNLTHISSLTTQDNPSNGIPAGAASFATARSQGQTHDIEFYNNYVSSIIVTQITPEGVPSMTVKLNNCYPTAIHSMPLSWAATNEYHVLRVNFTYFNRTISYTPGVGVKGLADNLKSIAHSIIPSPRTIVAPVRTIFG